MRVAARDGLEGISLRHVGAEAGVTSGMVQHYFPTKDAMMHHAMDLAGEYFAERMSAAEVPESAPVRDRVRTLLQLLLPMDERARDAGLVSLAFVAYAATNEAAAGKLGHGNSQMRDYLGHLLSRARDDGRLAADVDPDQAAVALLAATDGLALHCITGGLAPETAAVALDHQVSLLFAET